MPWNQGGGGGPWGSGQKPNNPWGGRPGGNNGGGGGPFGGGGTGPDFEYIIRQGQQRLREVLPVPVLGMTESALASACLLGHRFSIIAISQRIQAWYRETVEANDLIGRLASIRALDRPLKTIGGAQEDNRAQLKELCERAVDEDRAEVLILAGGPLAGLARSLAGELPVPVVDGVSSAVRHAESLVALKPGRATRGSFAPPPQKPNRGLPPAIERLLKR
jgi:hypothetical protein